MKTSSYSIFDFLEACGGNWRNTVCVSCEHCFQPCRAECRGCLLTADMEGRPMAISLTRFEAITGWKVEPCDCIGTLSRYAFDELFRYYRLWECADPVACLLCYLDSNISAAPNSKREQVNPSYDAAPLEEDGDKRSSFSVKPEDKRFRPAFGSRRNRQPSDPS